MKHAHARVTRPTASRLWSRAASAAAIVAVAATTTTLSGIAQAQPGTPPEPATPTPQTPTPASSPVPDPTPNSTPNKVDPLEAPLPTSAQNNIAEGEMTPELDRAVEQGLRALAAMQNDDNSFGEARWGRSVAITALACLAFMSDGNLPGRGQYGDVVERGLQFVLSNCAENGLIAAEAANGPMYGHGFAALFLGEIYGMTAGAAEGTKEARLAAQVHEAVVKAVRLIQATQNEEGGWRYNPVPFDADVSVTICQIMALRSARNAGLEVPKETIDRAVAYVRKCQNEDGGFKYQLQSGPSGWERSAAGIASLFYAGIYEDQAIDQGLRYLMNTGLPGRAVRRSHYYYGHYYGVQAMYLAGGAHWQTWWPAIREELIANQRPAGEWDDQSVGSAYGTSMALIILQMPKRYLPIFQK
ncbi:MAG: prenyltransferase/squalene oxidase repeat-containing protein [Planctomycetota bacterium]|nr:prenyltransferase/squalene oxidase repeat-containing protein [Planctomycetota bacterium]